MFYCPLHNWYSDEAPCPACHQTIITTLATSTEGTSTEQPEPESKGKDVFTWDEKLVKEMIYAKLPIPEHYAGNLQKCLDEFKQSKQPLKPDTNMKEGDFITGDFSYNPQPDTKEERREVIDFEFDQHEKWIRLHFKNEIGLLLKDDYSRIKAAIEAVLNNDNEHDRRINFWKDVNQSLIDKKYTQQQLDEAIQKVEVNAWNFAREKMIIDGKPTERQYRFLSYYDYEVYKKDSETLYQKSLQDNTNTKTSKHWT